MESWFKVLRLPFGSFPLKLSIRGWKKRYNVAMNEVIIRLKNQNKLHSASKWMDNWPKTLQNQGRDILQCTSFTWAQKLFSYWKHRLINEGSCSKGPGEQLGGGNAVFDEVEFSLSHNHWLQRFTSSFRPSVVQIASTAALQAQSATCTTGPVCLPRETPPWHWQKLQPSSLKSREKVSETAIVTSSVIKL